MSIESLQRQGLIESVQPDLDGARIVIDDVADALMHADAIVAAVKADLG